MGRVIACVVAATLLGGCGVASNAARDDATVVSGDPVNSESEGRATTSIGATTRPGFCPKENVEIPMRRHVEAFRACYEAQLTHRPELEGRVDARWTLGRDGRVVHVATTGLEVVGACVAAVIKGIRFPPPNMGCETVSNYPFVFARE